jgi:hypothetical protein
MYETETNFNEVQNTYPDQINQLQGETLKSKAKVKETPIRDIPISQFKFEYTCSIIIKGSMMGNVFIQKMKSGELQREAAEEKAIEDAKTLEQKFQDRIKRTTAYLTAFPPGSKREFKVRLPTIPSIVHRKIYGQLALIEKENAKIRAMTPEQRADRTREILSQLKGNPGFRGFSITPISKMDPK